MSSGSRLFGRVEDGVPFRAIAEAIGKHLNLPVVSISREEADAHFGFLGTLAAINIPRVMPRSGIQTKEFLGWRPVQPTLIADLEQGTISKTEHLELFLKVILKSSITCTLNASVLIGFAVCEPA